MKIDKWHSGGLAEQLEKGDTPYKWHRQLHFLKLLTIKWRRIGALMPGPWQTLTHSAENNLWLRTACRLQTYIKHHRVACGMSQLLPQVTFTIPLREGKHVELAIAQPDLRVDNLNLTTWAASYVLAKQLHNFHLHVDDKVAVPVLELGAGTGLVGLTAALLWHSKTILTDLPGIVPGLRQNVDLNASVIGAESDILQCGSLDWRSPSVLMLESGSSISAPESKAGIIIAADTIYDEEHPELLSSTVLTWLARTHNARVLLCYPLRVAYLDQIREIWSLLEAGGLVADIEGQEQADSKDWDDECLCEFVVWRWNEI